MRKSKYEDLFETSVGKNYDVRINELEKRFSQIRKSYERKYHNDVETILEKYDYSESLAFVNSKIEELTEKRNKDIRNDERLKKIISKIESLKKSREESKQDFIRLNKQKSSNNWKMLVNRTVAPQVLELLEKSPKGITEVSVVNAILGDDTEKLTPKQMHNRYCMVLYYMENLGWVKREGSGTAYDAKVSFITDLGKKQLETYRICKKFDYSLQ